MQHVSSTYGFQKRGLAGTDSILEKFHVYIGWPRPQRLGSLLFIEFTTVSEVMWTSSTDPKAQTLVIQSFLAHLVGMCRLQSHCLATDLRMYAYRQGLFMRFNFFCPSPHSRLSKEYLRQWHGIVRRKVRVE